MKKTDKLAKAVHMTKEEKVAIWYFGSRCGLGLLFALIVGALWIYAGEFPLKSGMLFFALFVMAFASYTNIAECKRFPRSDVGFIELRGNTLRDMRALSDLPALWGVAAYLFCVFVAQWGFRPFVWWYVVIFALCTIPQALGLAEKMPVVSTFLGRFVPVALMAGLYCMQCILDENALEALLGAVLLGATTAYVIGQWRTDIKNDRQMAFVAFLAGGAALSALAVCYGGWL